MYLKLHLPSTTITPCTPSSFSVPYHWPLVSTHQFQWTLSSARCYQSLQTASHTTLSHFLSLHSHSMYYGSQLYFCTWRLTTGLCCLTFLLAQSVLHCTTVAFPCHPNLCTIPTFCGTATLLGLLVPEDRGTMTLHNFSNYLTVNRQTPRML